MEDWFSRTQQLIGFDKLSLLQQSKVLVVGIGGVGAYAAEMLCRAGIGNITIIDGDTINKTNINRQLIALHSTLNQPKVNILAQRLQDINPELILDAQYQFIEKEEIDKIIKNNRYDFVVDAIDTLSPKIALITACLKNKTKIISSMGAGGRIDPSKITFADISEPYHCGLAKAVLKY